MNERSGHGAVSGQMQGRLAEVLGRSCSRSTGPTIELREGRDQGIILAIGSHRRLETQPKHKHKPLSIMNSVAMQTGCPQRCAGPPPNTRPVSLHHNQVLALSCVDDQWTRA